MNKQLARFSVNDFDKYNCLKISIWYWLTIAFLIKGYVVALLSLSNMRDKLAFIRYVYPNPDSFYTSLLTGIPGILLLVVILARRPGAATVIKRLWRKFYHLLVVAVIVETVFVWLLVEPDYKSQVVSALAQSALSLALLGILAFDHRAKINLSEFPEPIETEPSNGKKQKT
ncbi:DUF2919 family protein [Thalassotalea ponticola]|nr:DUF2919 family protein [Thalassotalea ponticola]